VGAEYVTFSDGEILKITRRDLFDAWWYGTRLGQWYYKHRPKPPPFALDPVMRHCGWVEGVPACKGPICEEHEWKVTM
jgi:hypothetical protein